MANQNKKDNKKRNKLKKIVKAKNIKLILTYVVALIFGLFFSTSKYYAQDLVTGVESRQFTVAPTLSPSIPLKLFDIVLSLDSNTLTKSSDLVAIAEFSSFGTEPTLVKLNYKIEDANRMEIFNDNVEVIVETEKVVTKTFPSLDVGNGIYTLILTTNYGQNVVDEFRQTFQVKEPPYQTIANVAILVLIILIGRLIIRKLSKDKKEFIRL